MKHLTLLGLVALLTLPAQGQVIFQNGFEDWSGTTPDGWFGVRTNIAASNVTQVSDNVHGGSFAVRLENTSTSSHQRFTTQPLTVENNQGYEVNFWVRGQGDIRLGLYDGRSTSSGYAPYTSYVSVNNADTWQEVTLTIAAAMDAADAEFILSVRSTVAPEHLVVDDVTISLVSVPEPDDVTIQQIQETTAPDGASPLVGTTVRTTGVVTATVGTSGFFLQGGSGAWSGIYIFNNPSGLLRGDSVRVTGNVVEFNGQTQLSGIANLENLGSGYSVPQTVITTAESINEEFESVLVTVESATCTASGAFGQFTVNDGSGPALVDDVIYAYPFSVNDMYNITGILQYAFSEWRILPRDAADVSLVTAVGELAGARVDVYPNPAAEQLFISLGSTGERVEYMLTDAMGRLVNVDVLLHDRGTITVSGLPNGLYLLTLRSAGTTWTTRVMVQH